MGWVWHIPTNDIHCPGRCGTDGDIQLSGQFILEDHCTFSNEGGKIYCTPVAPPPPLHVLL